MRVSIPYSANRRYLTGIDWTICALGAMSEQATGGGNTFQIALELKGALDPVRFQAAVESFVSQFPVLGGHPARDWTLAPYWKMPPAGRRVNVPVEFVVVGSDDVVGRLEQSVNQKFPDRVTHLAFRVFRVTESRHFLAVHFDHRLFDAAGAEAFLGLFHDWSTGQDCRARIQQIALKEPAHLDDWMQKFEAGKQLVRLLNKFAETTIRVLPRPVPLMGRKTRYKMMSFNEVESQAIINRANQEAGFLMFMPYTLAVSLEALAPAFSRAGAQGQDFLVSVSVDLRTPEMVKTNLFFNQVSFLFFQIPVELIQHRKPLIDSLRVQMYEQIKSGFPKALHESSMLMRIVPLKPLSRMMLKPLRGEFASLGFTCVGKSGYPYSRFMELELLNLIHMPLVPVPPGIGFFINQFGAKMNAVLSYVDGMLADDDAQRVLDDVRRLL